MFEIKIETGTAIRGKYTFPNRCAFPTNVFDVLFKQSEK